MTPEEYRKLARPQRNKYRAKSTVVDGIRFDSMLESRRYHELKFLEWSGQIENLKIHHRFPLYGFGGTRLGCYEADFYYLEGSKLVVEDTKGVVTDLFKLKWKLMKDCYPGLDLRIITR